MSSRSARARRLGVVLLVLVGLLGTDLLGAGQTATAGRSAMFRRTFRHYSLGDRWVDGEVIRKLKCRYAGYGQVAIDSGDTKLLAAAPKAASDPSVTHASLVTTRRFEGNIELRVRLKTIDQLRKPKPNPWEAAWVLWNYTDDVHFYYLILKPNGWELGKEDPHYPGAQRYLRTKTSPRYPIGRWYTVRIQQVRNVIRVWANGRYLGRFRDRQRPYHEGSVGFYTEDARVRFDDLEVRRP